MSLFDPNELPAGFAMMLAVHPEAMDYYGRLNQQEKEAFISFIESAGTEEESKQRVETAVMALNNHNRMF